MENKYCISVINEVNGKLVANEQYHLTDTQVIGHTPLLIKRLVNGEINGYTVEVSKEVETAN